MAWVSGDDDATLCSSIWSKLPDEMVELVLKQLPFSSLIQFRVICKQWNSVITSSEFSRACRKQIAPKCVPILVANDLMESSKWSFNPYNSTSNSWLTYSLSFLHDVCDSRPLYLTASSGGLMCFETEDRRNLIVCNPITRRWRLLELPDATGQSIRTTSSCQDTDYRHTLTGLIVDSESGDYKLIVASLAKCAEERTLVYDSAKLSWTRKAQIPEGKRFVNPAALTCNGNLYCLVKNPLGLEERTCIWRVLKYEVESDSWCEAPVVTGWPGNSSTELELVEHQGQVLLVARVLNRRWLPNNTFYRVWYNTFFKVCESSGGHKLTLEQDRKVFQALDRSTGSTEFKTVVTKYPGSFAGHGDLIYTTGIPFTNNSEVQVLKVNSRTQSCLFLPGWRKADSKSKLQMEIRLLEPSLIAAV
ncbi:unnamed protein product [Calypogeia fissa]